MYRKIKLSEIEQLLGNSFLGGDCEINSLNLSDRASEYESVLSYVTSSRYVKAFTENTKIKALFLTEELLPVYQEVRDCSFFVVDKPEEVFYNLHQMLINKTDFYKLKEEKIILTKDIHSSVIIEEGVYIGENVSIGYNSVIKKGTVIKDNVTIGENVVIGCEGFQIINMNGKQQAIQHMGGVLIEQDVFIAAGTTVSKSLFEGAVIIGENSKVDAQVHIGHNCIIGKNSVITGNSLLMGSVTIGNNVWIAPSSTIANKVELSDNSFVGSMSLVNKKTFEDEKVMGIPAVKFKDYMKLIVNQNKIILSKK